MRCAVYGCNSDNQSKKHPCVGVKFFRFPKNEVMAKRWVKATGRRDKINLKYASVCSKHFEDTDFKVNLRHQLLNYTPKSYRGLNDDAVPSLNLPFGSKKKTPKSRALSIKRERKKLVQELLNASLDVGGNQNNNSEGENNNADVGTQNLGTVDTETTCNNIQYVILSSHCSSDNKCVQTTMTNGDINNLIELVDNKNKEILELRQLRSALEHIFTKNQIAKIKSNKRIRWTASEISSAIALYSAGPRVYRILLEKGYPYPAVPTLRAWLRKIKIQPGILRNVFKLIDSSDFNKKDRVCSLVFHEIKLRKEYTYDRAEDETLKPFAYTQVVVMSGLFKSWKQPVFFDFDMKMTAEKLLAIIKYAESSGFHVVSIVCDLGGGNKALRKELGVTFLKPYFMNPNNSEKIFVFADVPHLLKLLRNHFVDEGLIINEKEINKEIAEVVLDATAASDLRVTHKLTKEQLNVTGVQRQQVKFAAHLFSRTMSEAISSCGMQDCIPQNLNWSECAEFFKLVSNWFDIFNGSVSVSDGGAKSKDHGLAIQEQHQILDKMSKAILNLRVKGRNSLLPFQTGILISNHSFKLLREDLQRKFGIEHILTRRLNQDVLKHFFGVIRAKDGQQDLPNVLEFKCRLRSCIMGKNEGVYSELSSIEVDDIPDLADAVFESELRECDGLENLALFIRSKTQEPEQESNDEVRYITNYTVDEEGFLQPTADFLLEMEELENIFVSLNGDSLCIRKNFLKTHMAKSTNVNCSEKIKNLFFRTRMYFRIKELNHSIV